MGGRAFLDRNLQSHRMTTTELHEIASRAIQVASEKAGTFEYYIVKSIAEKEDHGDIDIVIKNTGKEFIKFKDAFKDNFYPVFINGLVISVLFEHKYQIDFIFQPEASYDYACQYFNWNDLGNLVGRMMKPLGLKHGSGGAAYIYRPRGMASKYDIPLNITYQETLKLCGLKPYDDNHVFKTYKEVFDYVISSPYFAVRHYLYENLNNTNRVRDKKRKTYNMFLEYVKDIEDNKDYLSLDLIGIFPHLKDEIKKIDERLAKAEAYREVFDAQYIIEKTKYTGAKLGKFIGYVSKRHSKDELIEGGQDFFKQVIDKCYQEYKGEYDG